MCLKWYILVFIYVQFVTGGLLKKPKVYNTLITTDENLTPSRAIPVIQPVYHHLYNPYLLPFSHSVVQFHPGPTASFVSSPYVNQERYLKESPITSNDTKQTVINDSDGAKDNESHGLKPSSTVAVPIKFDENNLPPSLIPIVNYSTKNDSVLPNFFLPNN